MIKGIDVSSYQGRIDWLKVKSYIDFAIIRCGFGNDLRRQDDVYYERNASLCEKNNIPYGVYLYSYATNLDEARSEVEHTLRLIKGKRIEYPIFLDVESKRQLSLRKEELTEIVKYYCDEMEKNGYYVGIYASLNTFRSHLNSPVLDAYDKWVAEWNDEFTYKGSAGMWQHTSYEELAGIKGRVDGDIAFYDYPKIITNANLNHLNKNSKYKVGEKVFVTGPVYKEDDDETIITELCDKEVVIEGLRDSSKNPYRIKDGYIKENEIYKKV